AVAGTVRAAAGAAAGSGTKTRTVARADARSRSGARTAARAAALRRRRRTRGRFNRARQRVERRRQFLCGNVELLDRIRLDLGLLLFERRLLLDRNRQLVFPGKLSLARRLLHLVAAATAATARSGLAQPDDLLVGVFRQQGRGRSGRMITAGEDQQDN